MWPFRYKEPNPDKWTPEVWCPIQHSILWNFWNLSLLGTVFCLWVPLLRIYALASFSNFCISFYLAITLKQTMYQHLGADDLIQSLQRWSCCIPEKHNYYFLPSLICSSIMKRWICFSSIYFISPPYCNRLGKFLFASIKYAWERRKWSLP